MGFLSPSSLNVPDVSSFFFIAVSNPNLQKYSVKKTDTLSLTECAWEFQNYALWDTHSANICYVVLQRRTRDNTGSTEYDLAAVVVHHGSG